MSTVQPEHCAFCPEKGTSITCYASDGRPCCYDCSKSCSQCVNDTSNPDGYDPKNNPHAPSDAECLSCLGVTCPEDCHVYVVGGICDHMLDKVKE